MENILSTAPRQDCFTYYMERRNRNIIAKKIAALTNSTTIDEEVSLKTSLVDLVFRTSTNTKVTKGFGPFSSIQQAVLIETHLFYPPLSNAFYSLRREDDTDISQSFKSTWTPTLDGVALVKEQMEHQQRRDEEASQAILPSLGEQLAEPVDWDKATYTDIALQEYHNPIPGVRGDRAAFVELIDDGLKQGDATLMYCERCKQRHIPWGSPMTMGDRDTCLSMLPNWFPTEGLEKPWDTFITLVNDLVKFDEIEKGWMPNPNASGEWDMNWHDGSPEWRAVGRREGWWKCRTGKREGETNVPLVEVKCKRCHPAPHGLRQGTTQVVKEPQLSIAAKKIKYEAWIAKCMKEAMEKDREFVIKRIREQGY